MESESRNGSINPLSDSFYDMYSMTIDDAFTQENGYTQEKGYTPEKRFTQENGYTREHSFTNDKVYTPDVTYSQDTTHRRTRPRTVENNNVNGIVIYDDPGVKYPDGEEWPASPWKPGHIFSAAFVRLLLISHNILTVWRVTEDFDDDIFWFLVTANILLVAEGLIVMWKRGGVEYSWWCPCFLMYLATTIPAIWLLQLNQYNALVSEDERVLISISGQNTTQPVADPTTTQMDLLTSPTYVTTTTPVTQKLVTMLFMSVTNAGTVPDSSNTTAGQGNFTGVTGNITELVNTTIALVPSSSAKILAADSTIDSTISSETWIIIVEEALVYLLVFGRWLLPRGEVSREFLADLLLEFLAIASDIMELLAVFDEEEVRSNLKVTLWIMAVWSASFIQFIPILVHKRRLRNFRKSPEIQCIKNSCGNKFVEIVVTCMSVVLQDGPFLVLRMYIIIRLRIVTYSLVFFILKNIVTLLLLGYRLMIMCYRIRSCRRKDDKQRTEDEYE